jgi:hypothetical protein
MSEIHAPEAGVQQAGVASESTGDSKSAAPRNDTAGTTDTADTGARMQTDASASLASDAPTLPEGDYGTSRKIVADSPAVTRRSRNPRVPRRVDTTHPYLSLDLTGPIGPSGSRPGRRKSGASWDCGYTKVPLGRIKGFDPDVSKEIGAPPASDRFVVARTVPLLRARLITRPICVFGDATGEHPLYWLANGQDLMSLVQHLGEHFMVPAVLFPRNTPLKDRIRFALHGSAGDFMLAPPREGAGEQIMSIVSRLEQFGEPPLAKTNKMSLAVAFGVDPRQLNLPDKTKSVTVPEFPHPTRRGTRE